MITVPLNPPQAERSAGGGTAPDGASLTPNVGHQFGHYHVGDVVGTVGVKGLPGSGLYSESEGVTFVFHVITIPLFDQKVKGVNRTER